MNIRAESYSVSKIRTYWTQTYLSVNHEYQRAPRWERRQKQLLIDSLLRGYPLPLFYFHKKYRHHGDSTIADLEIIDGQQRIRAIAEFCAGDFPLLDPARHRNLFPKFIWDANEPCGWANKRYTQLDFDLQNRLDNALLSVAIITTDNDDEVRDIFVRLQSGSPLRAQEKRDAFPGGMPAFIKLLGGETIDDDDQRPMVRGGHRFFRDFTKYSTPKRTHSAREMASKIVMQLIREGDGMRLDATNAKALDDFYYQQVGFREDCDDAKRVRALFDDVSDALERYEGAPLDDIEWVHLFVLWQRLQRGYANSWKPEMANMLRKFKVDLTQARNDAVEMKTNPMWTKFGMVKSGSGPDAAKKFIARQDYFDEWFISKLNPRAIDGRRTFDEDLRRRLFEAQTGTCGYFDQSFCGDGSPMRDEDAEVHHILPYSKGGETEPENAVIVHAWCNRHLSSRHLPVTHKFIRDAIKSVSEGM